MSDISVSERRLSAALDRIDQLLEQGLGNPGATQPQPEKDELEKDLAVLRAENARLAYDLAALRSAGDVTPDDVLADLRKRLDLLGEQTVRLAAANDQLSAANNDLLAAAAGEGGIEAAVLSAKDAEIAALKAARAAETAQLDEVMAELERLFGASGETGAEPADPGAVVEAAADEAGIPEGDGEGRSFSGVYADEATEGQDEDADIQSEGR